MSDGPLSQSHKSRFLDPAKAERFRLHEPSSEGTSLETLLYYYFIVLLLRNYYSCYVKYLDQWDHSGSVLSALDRVTTALGLSRPIDPLVSVSSHLP